MAHNDKPLGNIKRVKIHNEVNKDPAQYPLKDGTLVDFPDIWDLPLEEGDDFMAEMNRAANTGRVVPFLKKWLTKDHYARLVAEYPTLRQIQPVFYVVLQHYQGVWGSEGEELASEN